MELVAEFAEESLIKYGTYMDLDKLTDTFNAVKDTSFALVVKDKVQGVLGGRVITDFCSKNPVYEEVIWYVRKQYRRYGIKLYYFLEQWCKIHEIDRITMSCMHNSKTDKLMKFYEKMGFTPMETRYIKILK